MSGPLDRLPNVIAHPDSRDERSEPLLRALGHLVRGALSLEKGPSTR